MQALMGIISHENGHMVVIPIPIQVFSHSHSHDLLDFCPNSHWIPMEFPWDSHFNGNPIPVVIHNDFACHRV